MEIRFYLDKPHSAGQSGKVWPPPDHALHVSAGLIGKLHSSTRRDENEALRPAVSSEWVWYFGCESGQGGETP